MSRSSPTRPRRPVMPSSVRRSPVLWFALLVRARDRGDTASARACTERLARLGVEVQLDSRRPGRRR